MSNMVLRDASASKNHDLLSEAHGIKQPQVALHHHEVLNLLRIQLGPLGGDHIAGRKTPAQI